MPSQLFEIRELVELICEAVLTYRLDAECGHAGVQLDSRSLMELVALARVNKFIGNIASTVLWREPTNGLMPSLKVLPDEYVFTIDGRVGSFQKMSGLPTTVGDFERFIVHSESVRYLNIHHPSPALLKSNYYTLFPMRPCFPQLKSLICSVPLEDALYLLHSGVTSLQIDRFCGEDGESAQEAERISRELRDRTPNLARFRDMVSIPNRGGSDNAYAPAGTPFQKCTDRLLHEWIHLRHLEVSRFLPDIHILFSAISPLQNLEYLKIAIAWKDYLETSTVAGVKRAKGAFHTASKLEIEGKIEHLHLALALCSPGTRLTQVSLLFYTNVSRAQPAQEYFNLPPTLSLVPIVKLTVDLQDNWEQDLESSPDWQLPSSAFSTLTTLKCDLVKLDIRIPYCVTNTQLFLDQVAKSSSCLEHFVLLRSIWNCDETFHFPIITFEDMIGFAISLPKLQYLGLEIDCRHVPHFDDVHDHLQASNGRKGLKFSHIKTLEVGASPINDIMDVAKCLKHYFPFLTNLGCEGGYGGVDEIDDEQNEDEVPDEDFQFSYKFGSRWGKVSRLLGYVYIKDRYYPS